MKTFILIMVLAGSFSRSAKAETFVALKFSKMQSMVAKAIVQDEIKSGIRATFKDISDFELTSVGENELEVGAIAPGYAKEDGIPNYCSVVLSRLNDSGEYTVTAVDCSPLD